MKLVSIFDKEDKLQCSLRLMVDSWHRKERLIMLADDWITSRPSLGKKGLRLQQTKGVNLDEKSQPSDAASS